MQFFLADILDLYIYNINFGSVAYITHVIYVWIHLRRLFA